jgi:hypothetical protein
MAFGFLKERVPDPQTPAERPATPGRAPAPSCECDCVGETPELLELERGGAPAGLAL